MEDDNPTKRFVEPSAIGAILVPVSRMCHEAFYVSRATTKKRLIVADCKFTELCRTRSSAGANSKLDSWQGGAI
jgi:hypothetical protein